MTMTMKDKKYPRHEQKKNAATAHMKGEHHDAELADGDEAANARDDEDTKYPRHKEKGNSTTAPMRGEHYDAELADGDGAADALSLIHI